MPIAYPVTSQLTRVLLSREELFSLFYHDIFEYPMTIAELIKWSAGKKIMGGNSPSLSVSTSNGYFHLKSREGLVLKRLMRKRISARKFEIAKEAVRIFSLIPTIKLVAVTGALSMGNASDEADIDFLIVTKKGTLWTTRLLTYILLKSFKFGVRRPRDRAQKDKLCLNMWLDESDLSWDTIKRNAYTAHEIAQIRPLINKENAYEKFIAENNWIREYWPNAVRELKTLTNKKAKNGLVSIFVERFAFIFQAFYMKGKITREVVTPTRALFHPVDWSQFVLRKLSS